MVNVRQRGGWDSWPSKLEFEAKVDTRRLAFEEGVHEDEPELFFRGGKEEWQKFCETVFAKDQKEQDPVEH